MPHGQWDAPERTPHNHSTAHERFNEALVQQGEKFFQRQMYEEPGRSTL